MLAVWALSKLVFSRPPLSAELLDRQQRAPRGASNPAPAGAGGVVSLVESGWRTSVYGEVELIHL